MGTSAGNMATITVPITVPAGATLGNTRLRIRVGSIQPTATNNPCGAITGSNSGQAQDFLVNIVDPANVNGHVFDSDSNPVAGATELSRIQVYKLPSFCHHEEWGSIRNNHIQIL
jgi:hypothetical protein